MSGEWSIGGLMRRFFAGRAIVVGTAVFATLAGTSASAEILGPIITVTATSGGRTASYAVPFQTANYNETAGTYDWHLNGTVNLLDSNGSLVATIGQLSAHYVNDPIISLGFLVTAGAADTSFQITSALLGFAPINPAIASASAQIGATDQNGNGVTVTGGYAAGSRSYIAHYNGFVPGGTNYATLVPNQATGAFQTTVASDGQPPGGGFLPIGGPIVSMSTQFDFTLSARDSAGGTSVFVVVPEPSAMALLAIGGLGLLIRRR
jgi:hypothetical protein